MNQHDVDAARQDRIARAQARIDQRPRPYYGFEVAGFVLFLAATVVPILYPIVVWLVRWWNG